MNLNRFYIFLLTSLLSINLFATVTIDEFPTNVNGFTNTAPLYIVSGPDGNLWFTVGRGVPNTYIGKITTQGIITSYSTASGLNLGSIPLDIIVGPDKNLWFTDVSNTNPAVGKVDPGNGSIVEYTAVNAPPGGTLASNFFSPNFILNGPDGNLWFNNGTTSNYVIGNILPNNGNINIFSSPSPINTGGSGNGSVANGMLWFLFGNTGTNPSYVESSTLNGTVSNNFIANGADLQFIVTDKNDNLWFTDNSTPAIWKLMPNNPSSPEKFTLLPNSSPFQIIVGPDTNFLWFTDPHAHAIGRVRIVDGHIDEFVVPTTPANISTPLGLVSGPDGNIWFTDIAGVSGQPAIGRVSNLNNPTPTIERFTNGLSSTSLPFFITVGPDNNLWFTDESLSNPAIGRVNIPKFELTKSGPAQILAGSFLIYQLKIKNTLGQDTVAHVTDTLPAGLQFVSASNGGTLQGNTVVFDVPITNGQTITLTIKALVSNNLSGNVTNSFTVNNQTSAPFTTNVISLTCSPAT